MTPTERLLARIKQLCRDNPASLIDLKIITDADGEPCMWFPDRCLKVEGNDQVLIIAGVKPAVRKEPML